MALPARTEHLTAKEAGACSDVVAKMLPDLSKSFVNDLIDFGAVYLNRTRLDKDAAVSQGDYIRVHASPRRYADAYSYNWEEALVYSDIPAGFVVVNKPRGVPVGATIDNAKETVIAQVQKTLGGINLIKTHQMDVDTSGLLVLGTRRDFVSKFNKKLKEGAVERQYRALVRPKSESHVLDGPQMLTHFIDANNRRTPRTFVEVPPPDDPSIDKKERPRWLKCQMEVLSARSCELAWAPWDHQQELLQHLELRPVTGRTHQLRGQLACAGTPILGDNMYTGILEGEDDESLVCPTTMKRRARSDSHRSPGLALQLHAIELPSSVVRRGSRSHRQRDRATNTLSFALSAAWWHDFIQ